MNSPIRYFGSKGTMYNNIIKHFPLITEYDTYVEPYGGTFVVGLKKEQSKIEVYNDLEQNVYSLYKVLSDSVMFESFKQKCDLTIYSQDLRNDFKDKLKYDDLDIITRAFYFFYVNRTSHNGIGGFSMNSSVRRGMSKAVSDFLSCIDRLPELHERLSSVIVSNMDGIKLILKYDNPRTLLYLDPPYHQSTRTGARYKVDMDNQQHEELVSTIIKSRSKILISGYECELYNKLTENGFIKTSFEVKTIDGNFKPKTKTEYLYYNYTI
jgi:DNA adenine methylase